MVSVSILFIPIVFFWALFDQQVKYLLSSDLYQTENISIFYKLVLTFQGSTWVLQARRMDGRVGPITILPDQMNTFNPLISEFVVILSGKFIIFSH